MAFLQRAFCAFAILLLASAAHAQSPAVQTSESAEVISIRALLDAQVEAWNRGDLTGYMAGYRNSPKLVFVSGASVTRGWRPTLERYRRAYKQSGRKMGRLDFSELEIEPIGADSAYALGRWRLRLRNGSVRQGAFSLVLRKLDEGWRIVLDHSS